VGLTFFAARLLQTSFLQLIGGALILWIAVKLFADADPKAKVAATDQFWRAIRFIVIADITMSIDNILAIAAASKGNMYLLIFGLGLSIPLVIFTSGLLSMLMDRYRFIIYLGAAILGKVAAEMIMTDSYVVKTFHPSPFVQYCVEALTALGVIVAGKLISRKAEKDAAYQDRP
jgi:YjbE family integral membrane protein